MGQTHKVIFAPRASQDLEAIVKFIAKNSGTMIAERFGMQLVDKALSLAALPERGRVVPEMGLPYREIIFGVTGLFTRLKGWLWKSFGSGTPPEAYRRSTLMNLVTPPEPANERHTR